MRDLFRRYVDARLETYRNVQDRAATKASLAEDEALQHEIWTNAVAASLRPGVPTPAAMLLLPALNEMIDITTTRVMATRNHPPAVIFMMLVGLAGRRVAGRLRNSVNRGRTWLHTLVFAAILSLTIYVIVDLEFPRLGLIRVDAADQALVDLRASMQ